MCPVSRFHTSLRSTLQDLSFIRMDQGAELLLSRAERLLLEVTSCIKPTAIAKKQPDPNIIRDLLLNTQDSSNPKPDTDSDLTQIEWLLRGLPEAYESEPTFDDEAVLAILKEGGSPPTQLTLPSVYAANQRILEKLSAAKMLRIRLCHLLVFSTRFGVRKEGSYLLIYPPSGCKGPVSNATQSIMLPLKEIEENGHILAQMMRRNDKRDSIRNYFVGSVDLEKTVDLELLLSDKTIRDWINCSPSGTIRIELHGFINSPSTIVRGERAEAMRLAHAVLPLGGLLGTPSLDAVVHCDLDIDDSSHSLIASRMNNISFGQRVSKQKALGPKLGTLTVRVSMLDEAQQLAAKTKHHGPRHNAGQHLLDSEVNKLMIPVVSKADRVGASHLAENPSSGELNRIHNALDYVPSEHTSSVPQQCAGDQGAASKPHEAGTDSTTNTTTSQDRAVYGSGKNISGVFGLALCAVEKLKLPIEHLLLIRETGECAQPKVLLTYKTSAKEREHIVLPLPDAESNEVALNAGQGRLYATDITHWMAPIVEVWLTWVSRAGEEKQLLGLARYPQGYKIGTLVHLPIVDAARSITRGHVVAAAVLGPEEDKVEISVHCLLNFYSLDKGGVRTTGDPHGIPTPVLPEVHHVDRDRAIRSSQATHGSAVERESAEESKASHASEPAQPAAEQAEQEHDQEEAADEADDSIGEICFLLNDRGSRSLAHIREWEQQPRLESTPAPAPVVASPEPSTASFLRSSVDSFLASETAAIESSEADAHAQSAVEETREITAAETDATTVEELPSAPAQSKNTQLAASSLHLLDLSLDGIFSAVQPASTLGAGQDLFGCFACYSLPPSAEYTVDGADAPTEHSLWWDGDCAVLNGSNRHRFECIHLDEESLTRVFGPSGALRLTLLACDSDGNLPANPVKLGEASLPLNDLCAMMHQQSGFQVFSLPLRVNSEDPRFRSIYRVAPTEVQEVRLSVSHRVEPVLMRRSAAELSGALHQSGAAEVPPVPAPAPATGPTDAVSRLLGFDITQEDLNDILYFRDTASPEPWVPFAAGDPHAEGATSIVDVMRNTSAAAQPLVAAVADHVFGALDWSRYDGTKSREVEPDAPHCLGEGYAALKQSLLELECINKLYHRPTDSATEVPARTHLIDQQHSIQDSSDIASDDETPSFETQSVESAGEGDGDSERGDSEVEAAEGEGDDETPEDNSTELYRSDFESFTIDDAVLQDDLLSSSDEEAEEEDRDDGAIDDEHSTSLLEGPSADTENAVASGLDKIPSDGTSQSPVLIQSEHEEDDDDWVVVVEENDQDHSGTGTSAVLQLEDLQQHPPGPAPAHPVITDISHDSDVDVDASTHDEAGLSGADENQLQLDRSGSGASDGRSGMICIDAKAATGSPEDPSFHDALLELDEVEEEEDGEEGSSDHSRTEASSDRAKVSQSHDGAEELHENCDSLCDLSASLVSKQSLTHVEESATQTDVSADRSRAARLLREVSLSGSFDGAHQVSLTGYLTSSGRLLVGTSFDSTASTPMADETGEASAEISVRSETRETRGTDNSGILSRHATPAGTPHASIRSTPNSSLMSHHPVDASLGAHSSTVGPAAAPTADADGMDEGDEEEEKEDSPNTSKIKNIVDLEINRIFGPEVALHPARELLAQTDRRAQPPLQLDAADQLGVQYWWSKIEAKPATTTKDTGVVPPTRVQSEMEALRESLQRVQAALPKEVVPQRRHAGQQRKFIDAETDRVSNIMMGVFRKSTL